MPRTLRLKPHPHGGAVFAVRRLRHRRVRPIDPPWRVSGSATRKSPRRTNPAEASHGRRSFVLYSVLQQVSLTRRWISPILWAAERRENEAKAKWRVQPIAESFRQPSPPRPTSFCGAWWSPGRLRASQKLWTKLSVARADSRAGRAWNRRPLLTSRVCRGMAPRRKKSWDWPLGDRQTRLTLTPEAAWKLPPPRRGEIWTADLGNPPSKHWILIVSLDSRNQSPNVDTVLIVPFGSRGAEGPTTLLLQPGETGLPAPSWLKGHFITTLPKARLVGREPRTLSPRRMREVCLIIRRAFIPTRPGNPKSRIPESQE